LRRFNKQTNASVDRMTNDRWVRSPLEPRVSVCACLFYKTETPSGHYNNLTPRLKVEV